MIPDPEDNLRTPVSGETFALHDRRPRTAISRTTSLPCALPDSFTTVVDPFSLSQCLLLPIQHPAGRAVSLKYGVTVEIVRGSGGLLSKYSQMRRRTRFFVYQ
jgi:hypothetical protein